MLYKGKEAYFRSLQNTYKKKINFAIKTYLICFFFLPDCFSYEAADKCEENNGTFYLRTCYNSSYAEEQNYTELAVHVLKRPPAEEYFT